MPKNYIYGFVEEETRLRERAANSKSRPDDAEDGYAKKIAAMPKERYPHFVKLAAFTTTVNGDEEFRFGLDVLLNGFAAQLEDGRR